MRHQLVTVEAVMGTERLSRKELYELVWTTPMSTLAAQFGISDVALAKTCRRMNVPHPGRGYWARLAARQKVKRPSLPEAAPKGQEWISLWRVENPSPKPPSVTAPDVPVAETLHGAHDVVEQLGSLLRRAKVDEFGRLIVPGSPSPVLEVTLATHRRALLLLDALCKVLAARGHSVALKKEKVDGGVKARLELTASGAAVAAALVERLDRRERARTKDEEERAAFHVKLGGKPPPPVYEHFGSGRLQLVMHYLTGPRSSWSDGKTPLERHLGRVVVELEAEAERRRLRREAEDRVRVEAERRQREAEAEKRRQEEAEARARYLHALEKDLVRMARRWAAAGQVRGFLEAVEEAVPVPDRGDAFRRWLRWANECANRVDPLSVPYKIAKDPEPDLAQLQLATGDGEGDKEGNGDDYGNNDNEGNGNKDGEGGNEGNGNNDGNSDSEGNGGDDEGNTP